ncbi:unnamed protein product [Phytophthora lilii]|uniref:Unnamed protein product n=1 Tax=Phytophthora lilii TaxID=2077276 RepID=A0A9W6X1F5_9STRA|nr:unnamed protein product [Phytophthora lilii]
MDRVVPRRTVSVIEVHLHTLQSTDACSKNSPSAGDTSPISTLRSISAFGCGSTFHVSSSRIVRVSSKKCGIAPCCSVARRRACRLACSYSNKIATTSAKHSKRILSTVITWSTSGWNVTASSATNSSCPPAEDGFGDDEASSESEEEDVTQRKRRQKRRQKTEEAPTERKKKVRKIRPLITKVKGRLNAARESQSLEKKPPAVTAAESSSSSSSESSSPSSSSSSSESSSSSSTESEGEATTQQKQKRAASKVATRKLQNGKTKDVAGTKAAASNGSEANANESEQTEKQPRRRRRRLRQRNGGRQRNGNQANTVETSAGLVSLPGNNSTAAQKQGQTKDTSVQPKVNMPSGAHTSIHIAGPRGYPRAKAHVLFDEDTGKQVEVQHAEEYLPNKTGGWAARRSQAPELAKYGPSSDKRQVHDDDTRAYIAADSRTSTDMVDTTYNDAPKRRSKGKYEEKWKRPYEIVATVLDKASGNSSEKTTSASDLTKALASYPTATAASFQFEPKDIIAFKTLTLCLETWQPVLSEWQGGQVRSMDTSGKAIELVNSTLDVSNGSVEFQEMPNSETRSIQTTEISELRFLSGPSYSSLRQSNYQPGHSTA